jgi:AsmA protein
MGGDMNKYLKYGLWAVGAVVFLFAAAVVFIVLTFDPNSYKPQLIQAVKESKQRTLKLDGDIQLHLFPSLSLSLGKVALSEFQSEREFISIDSASISLKLLPLLGKRIVVDEVSVSGVKAQLVRYRNGKTSIDDLLGEQAAPAEPAPAAAVSAPMAFDIAAVQLDKTSLDYSDESSGARYSVQDLSLKSGRIANGVPMRLDLAVRILSGKPRVAISAKLATTLTFDLEKGAYEVQGLDLQASGDALDFSGLAIKASGDASAQPDAQLFALRKFALSANGMKAKDRFTARLDAPQLSLTRDKFSGDGVAASVTLDGALGNLAATLSLPDVEGTARTFKVSSLLLGVDVKQPEQSFKFKLSSPVTGSIEAQQFNLSDLKLVVNASGDKLPAKSIDSELKGGIRADLSRQNIEGNLEGGLLQSQIKAKFALKNFNVPQIRYDLEIDQFDADPYLPKQTAGAKAQSKQAEPEQPFDLSALKDLNLEGSLRIGALKAANVKVAQLRVDVKAKSGILNVAPLSARLYQGSLDGKASVNAMTKGFAANARLTGIEVAPLLKDAADLDLAEGKGNIAFDLTSKGDTVSGLKRGLNGKASIDLADGAIKGINLTRLVQGIQSLSKDTTTQTLGVDKNEKTAFSEFKASFKIRNGIAHNDDLAVRSTVLRVGGSGDIDIGHDSMNYNAKAIFAKTDSGKTGTLPVNVSGPFDDLKFRIDYAALLKDVAKQKLDEKKEQLKEDAKAKAREELKRGLKNLFK